MGIQPFLPLKNDGSFVVGSFSGLYNWNPYEYGLFVICRVRNGHQISELSSIKFGSLAIAGGRNIAQRAKIFFDYNKGILNK